MILPILLKRTKIIIRQRIFVEYLYQLTFLYLMSIFHIYFKTLLKSFSLRQLVACFEKRKNIQFLNIYLLWFWIIVFYLLALFHLVEVKFWYISWRTTVYYFTIQMFCWNIIVEIDSWRWTLGRDVSSVESIILILARLT